MVKRILIITILCSTSLFAQRIELGIGGKGNFNWVQGNEDFYTSVIDTNNDTILMNFDQSKVKFSYSIPIFARFRTKFGFWGELAFTTEKLHAHVLGNANYSNHKLNGWAIDRMLNDFPSSGLTYNEFYDIYYNQYFNSEKETWNKQIAYEEIAQFNNVSLNFGYTFLRTKKFRPFGMLGFEWNSRTNKNHYQSLDYSTSTVEDYSKIYERMPRFNSHLFFINIGGGIELHNLQLGANIRQGVGAIQEYEFDENQPNNTDAKLYKNITSISLFLKYSLFNFNIRNSNDRKKLKKEDFKVLGDFKEKSKLIKLTLGAYVPVFTNVNSYYDHSETTKTHTISSDANLNSVDIAGNVWIKHDRIESGVDQNGQFTTVNPRTIIGLGRMKRISIFPKIGFGIEIAPVKYFAYETSINYQFTEFDTEASLYKLEYDWQNNVTPYQSLRTTVLRQTLHQFAIGQKINLKYDVTPDLFLGISGGVYFNFMAPGRYRFEDPGYNSDPLFESFDHYFFRGDNSKSFNEGNGNESYTYEYFDDSQNSFQPISDNDRMINGSGRFWMSWMASFDLYFDRLRISPFVEGRITDINFIYRDYLSGGISFLFYLRK